MTIIEIKNQLISHFYENNVFDMAEHGGKIRLNEDLEKVREEVITTVLNELTGRGMLVKIDSQHNNVWILTQSFDSFSQSVVITASAADVIADTINEFRDANNIPGDLCDKTKITEADILNLINICHVLLESEPEEIDFLGDEEDERESEFESEDDE